MPIVALLHPRRCSLTSARRALIVILLVIIFSSFNDIDPSHMMLVDCCMLCCQGCGPIAAPYDGGSGRHGPSSLITFYLAFYLGHKSHVCQAQV